MHILKGIVWEDDAFLFLDSEFKLLVIIESL